MDPCFTCPLPDCDESDRRCALKRGKAEYKRQMQRFGAESVSPEARAAYNAAYRVWKLEDLARKSEAQFEGRA